MAQTLKFGNGTWATKKGSTLAFNDQDGNYKPLPFTTTRATSATRVNKEGLIEIVGSDIPRIDFKDNTKGALLLEPSRTNLVTYSEDFSNAYWTKSGSSVVSGFVSPSGDLSAFKLVENTSATAHDIRSTNSISTSSGLDYTTSIIVKGNGRDLGIWSYNGTVNVKTYFDLTLGTVLSGNGVIEALSDGWYKCSLTVTSTVTSGNAYLCDLFITQGTTISYQGNGTSGVYIYGAQVEEGSYATSYIPTSGQSGGVTRVADACNNGANEQVINSTEGVFYAEIAGSSNDTVRYSISDGSNSNNIYIELSSSAVSAVGRLSAVNQFSIFSLQTITNYNKIAIKYKQNDFALWINGVEVGTDTSGNTYPTNTLDSLQFNRGDGGVVFYGNTKDLRVYNTALTDSELQKLTTI